MTMEQAFTSSSKRRNCDYCVKKKVKCSGERDRNGGGCDMCKRKGLQCVYSEKKKPGPKSRKRDDEDGVEDDARGKLIASSPRDRKASARAAAYASNAGSSFDTEDGGDFSSNPGLTSNDSIDHLLTPSKKAKPTHHKESTHGTRSARKQAEAREQHLQQQQQQQQQPPPPPPQQEQPILGWKWPGALRDTNMSMCASEVGSGQPLRRHASLPALPSPAAGLRSSDESKKSTCHPNGESPSTPPPHMRRRANATHGMGARPFNSASGDGRSSNISRYTEEMTRPLAPLPLSASSLGASSSRESTTGRRGFHTSNPSFVGFGGEMDSSTEARDRGQVLTLFQQEGVDVLAGGIGDGGDESDSDRSTEGSDSDQEQSFRNQPGGHFSDLSSVHASRANRKIKRIAGMVSSEYPTTTFNVNNFDDPSGQHVPYVIPNGGSSDHIQQNLDAGRGHPQAPLSPHHRGHLHHRHRPCEPPSEPEGEAPRLCQPHSAAVPHIIGGEHDRHGSGQWLQLLNGQVISEASAPTGTGSLPQPFNGFGGGDGVQGGSGGGAHSFSGHPPTLPPGGSAQWNAGSGHVGVTCLDSRDAWRCSEGEDGAADSSGVGPLAQLPLGAHTSVMHNGIGEELWNNEDGDYADLLTELDFLDEEFSLASPLTNGADRL